LIDKVIRGKIIEIIAVLLLVVTSIPVWNNFDKKITKGLDFHICLWENRKVQMKFGFLQVA